jgi:hypothetical protein
MKFADDRALFYSKLHLMILGVNMSKKDELGGVQVEGSQYLPNQKRNVTYVSRMQCMQAAVSIQIEEILKQNPQKKVVLITFNDEGED